MEFNERVRSARTCAVPEREGRALGAREGTGPDDDPMLRSLRVQSREEGEIVGKALGKMEGLSGGRAQGSDGDSGEDGALDAALARGGGFRGIPGGRGVRGSVRLRGRGGVPCRTAPAAQPPMHRSFLSVSQPFLPRAPSGSVTRIVPDTSTIAADHTAIRCGRSRMPDRVWRDHRRKIGAKRRLPATRPAASRSVRGMIPVCSCRHGASFRERNAVSAGLIYPPCSREGREQVGMAGSKRRQGFGEPVFLRKHGIG